MKDLLPLNMLTLGQKALIRQIIGQTSAVQRLTELGFTSGAEIQVLQHGSPCIVRLEESKLCFRDTEALNVLVQVVA